MKIPINEIFVSVDGEVNQWGQGKPTVFIRTQGCNLNCPYCDTADSKTLPNLNSLLTVDQITDLVRRSGIPKVTITGGEPLLYKDQIIDLCYKLLANRCLVSIETNGTIPIPLPLAYNKDVCFVVDYKQRIRVDEFKEIFEDRELWYPHAVYEGVVWIKFIIGSESDFIHACQAMEMFVREPNMFFAFAGIHEFVSPGQILNWMMSYKEEFPHVAKASINVQLHKLIFPEGEKSYILYKKP